MSDREVLLIEQEFAQVRIRALEQGAAAGNSRDACLGKPLRVIHVALGTATGGMEKMLVQFARFGDSRRFESSFVSLESRGAVAAELESLGASVTELHKLPGVRPLVVAKLARHLISQKPAVVHTHNTAGLVYGALAARLARVPRVIHTRHGQRFGASPRQDWLFRVLARRVDRVVCVSEDSYRQTLKDGVDSAQVTTVHNGVDTDRFAYRGPVPAGPIMTVARLNHEKDLATLLNAMAILREQGVVTPAGALRLHIVGEGPERGLLQAQVESLGLQNFVCFRGLRTDVAAELQTACMFVLPSLSEGVSLTLLEAMSTGLPVIATQVGGNSEVVTADCGLLIPPRDAGAMARAIRYLLEHPQLGLEFGRCGHTRARCQFDVRRMVGSYERLYTE